MDLPRENHWPPLCTCMVNRMNGIREIPTMDRFWQRTEMLLWSQSILD